MLETTLDATPALAEQLEFARFTHANLQDMVKLADSKATALLAVQSVVLTLLAGDTLGSASGTLTALSGVSNALATGVLLVPTLGAIFTYARVLHPNWKAANVLPAKGCPRLLWVGPADINRFGNSTDSFLAQLKQTTLDDQLADISFENLKIAGIVETKFSRLALATKWLWASLGSWAFIVLAAIAY